MPLHRHRTLLATEPEKSGLVYASDNNGAAVVGIKGKAAAVEAEGFLKRWCRTHGMAT